ncbi:MULTISPECIES: pseudouridine synthase [unclassified Mycoplasma]|uniref:pseudouridine synthase n=1 Tax=unclassified Mycoplasma TaxID=2683645 RepID=UPI00211BACE5|nr:MULTISPECIES: pseudouridine synthase [unclassified Mycoplasma]UUM19512.1 rRNA pseudouridine synthase [Mycoplasma sp. 1578d]UUM25135.1 rRNA pseudouridine synthase [Mycoplasma sp. 3686d]
MTSNLERVQKLLSQAGVASRREAENLIKSHRVTINGKIAHLGDKASFKDQILVDNKPIFAQEKVYFVLNKPPKTICTLKDNFNRTLVTDLIDTEHKIFPVGRLDYDTTGVLLLTNDGDLANKLMHPSYEIIRVYRARLNEPLSKGEFKKVNGPLMINNTESFQQVIQVAPKSYFVVLKVGTYHHVKKIFESVNKLVINLKRVEYAGITAEKLPLGHYRKLTFKEVKDLKNLVRLKEEQHEKKN